LNRSAWPGVGEIAGSLVLWATLGILFYLGLRYGDEGAVGFAVLSMLLCPFPMFLYALSLRQRARALNILLLAPLAALLNLPIAVLILSGNGLVILLGIVAEIAVWGGAGLWGCTSLGRQAPAVAQGPALQKVETS
jgi:hypothetical protein